MSAAQKYIAPESKSRSLYIQPKLEVGAINSPEEKEASGVAEKVMRIPSKKDLGMSGFGNSDASMTGLSIPEEKTNKNIIAKNDLHHIVTGGGISMNLPKAPEVLIKKVASVSSITYLEC